MQLILPKTNVVGEIFPLFFLAGPIKGGGDWQNDFCWELSRSIPECTIVVPCRWGADHPLYCHRVSGDENYFPHQTAWEYAMLNAAAVASENYHGAIIFWLPCESIQQPRNDGSPYGRDTYGELGFWRAMCMKNPSYRIIVGIEPNFPGRSVIQKNFELCLGGNFPIYSTLKETADAAADRILPM
jgi:hypothetical protein